MISKDDYRVKTVKSIYEIAGIRGLFAFLLSKMLGSLVRPRVCRIFTDGVAEPLYVRIPSSDALTYYQVFKDREYDLKVDRSPETIIDAGANIGLASIYFAVRFPSATIIAIEPEQSNFEMLKKNVAPYLNIVPINAALWNENKEIRLLDPGLGNSGFMTANDDGQDAAESGLMVPAITVDRIMQQYRVERIDIFKIDVEGAEMEIFEEPSLWIDKVDSLVVELHERMRPGSSVTFNRAIAEFKSKWVAGENVCATREGGCLVPA